MSEFWIQCARLSAPASYNEYNFHPYKGSGCQQIRYFLAARKFHMVPFRIDALTIRGPSGNSGLSPYSLGDHPLTSAISSLATLRSYGRPDIHRKHLSSPHWVLKLTQGLSLIHPPSPEERNLRVGANGSCLRIWMLQSLSVERILRLAVYSRCFIQTLEGHGPA